MVGRVVALGFLFIAITSCGGRSVGSAAPDSGVARDGAVAPDAIVAPDADLPVCQASFEIEVLPAVAQDWDPPQVDVTGDWVVYTSTGTGGGGFCR